MVGLEVDRASVVSMCVRDDWVDLPHHEDWSGDNLVSRQRHVVSGTTSPSDAAGPGAISECMLFQKTFGMSLDRSHLIELLTEIHIENP